MRTFRISIVFQNIEFGTDFTLRDTYGLIKAKTKLLEEMREIVN